MAANLRIRIFGSWAWHSLTFHGTRSLLHVAVLAVAAALVIGAAGFHAGYEEALRRNVDALGYQVLVTGKGCPHEAATLILRGGSIPMYIDESVHRQIVADPAVSESTRFFMQAVPLPDGAGQRLHVGIDEDFLRLKPGVVFQRGGWFSSATAQEAILGYNVAEYLRLGVGDALPVLGRPFAVRGVLDQLGTQDDGTVFLPLLTSQVLFDKRDRLTGIGIRLHELDEAPAFIERVYEVPQVQVVRLSQVQSAILDVLGGVRLLLGTFAVSCVMLALLAVLGLALTQADERRAEMGVLRALGCPASLLFLLIWSEMLWLGVCGAVGGGLLAWVLGPALEGFVRSALPFVPAGEVLRLTPQALFGGAAAVVAACLLAGIYPAWRSAVTSPAASMRRAA